LSEAAAARARTLRRVLETKPRKPKTNKEQHEKASCQLEAYTTRLAITTSEARQKLREFQAKPVHRANKIASKLNKQTRAKLSLVQISL